MGLVDFEIGGKVWQLGDYNGYLTYEGADLKWDTFYVLCPYGVGDTLYAAALMESLRKYRISSFKKLCLIVKAGHSRIPDWFDAVDEKIVSDEMVRVLNTYCAATKTWELKNFIYGHFHKDLNCRLFPEYEACSIKNMVYRYKDLVFHLPGDCPLEEPKIVPDWNLMEAIMREQQISRETVIFMPYANSTGLLPAAFWEKLACQLKKPGYTVLTNVKDMTEQPVKGTGRLCADIATTAAVCEQCRLVVSLRSGLCDVLAFTGARLAVLNKSEYHLKEWDLHAAVNRPGIYNIMADETDIISSVFRILNED